MQQHSALYVIFGNWCWTCRNTEIAVIQPRTNGDRNNALCNITRQRATELSQGLEMKVTSPDCRCHLSVKRHRRVVCDTKNLLMVGHFYVRPSNSDVGRLAGSSAEQSKDRQY